MALNSGPTEFECDNFVGRHQPLASASCDHHVIKELVVSCLARQVHAPTQVCCLNLFKAKSPSVHPRPDSFQCFSCFSHLLSLFLLVNVLRPSWSYDDGELQDLAQADRSECLKQTAFMFGH